MTGAARLRGWLRRLDRRIGFRGTFLGFFAFLDYVYGASLLLPPPELARNPAIVFVGHVLPLPVWGLLWLAVAVVLTVGMFARHDRWAFAAATGLKMLWGTIYLFGWLVFRLERGWVSAAIWLVLAAVMLRISGWPEPAPNQRRDGEVPRWTEPS